MKILILSDPLEKLLPQSDTSLSLLRYCLQNNHEVFLSTQENVSLQKLKLTVHARKALSCQEKALPQMDHKIPMSLTAFHVILIRKDPPFDENYQSLCWMLRLVETEKLFINRPSSLLQHHEKTLPIEAVKQGFLEEHEIVPSWIHTNHNKAPSPFGEAIIQKPWKGHGGSGIQRFPSMKEALTKHHKKSLTIYQPFHTEIYEEGDRRVFFFDGDYIADLVRLPPKNSFVANMIQGGIGTLRKLTSQQKNICIRLGKFLKTIGIFFAGVDMIGNKVSEINITSPTGFEKLRELGAPDIRKEFFQKIEKIIQQN